MARTQRCPHTSPRRLGKGEGTFEKDVEDVEVVLTSKVTRIVGDVIDDKSAPVTDYAVVVFPSDATKWIDRSRFVAIARPTQRGRFELKGLPPDDYLVIALPQVDADEWRSPEFLQQLRVHATQVLLSEGETRTVQLKLQRRP